MDGEKMAITKIVISLMLTTTTWVYGDNKGIEGDWQLILTELGQSFIIKISKTPDGTLAATSEGIPLDITFDKGKLRFEGGSPRCIFEGMIKEDGLTVGGELQQGDQQWPALLKRVEQVPIEAESQSGSGVVQASEKQLQDRGKLVAWWKLDEADGNDVADSSGNSLTGRLVGNPQWQPAGGKVNGALEFDSDGDYVEIGNESAFDITGPITVAAWVRINSFDKRWQTIVAKGDTAWRLQRTAEQDTLAFHSTGITSITGQWPEGIEGRKDVNDGQWHHVVGVYDGSEVLLYIDGLLENSSEASGAIQVNDFTVTIGGNSERTGRDWNGLIDEVCIIAGAIDANAVNALYTNADPIMIAQAANPQLKSPDKLVAWWKFDNDANDSAGANHGTIYGNPTYADGKVGRAINLDGNDYVDCGNLDSLNFGTGDWTISAWIKTTQSGTEPENRGTVFANGGDEEGGIRYALAVNEEYLGTVVLTTDNDTHKEQVIGKTTVNDGTWHHVVGNRSEGQLRVYVDGVLDGGSYLPAEYDLSGASQHNAYIGVITDHRDNSLFKYFVGLIDEVCVIRGSIDADGIRALYSGEDPAAVAKTAVITRPTRAAAAEQVDTAPSEAVPVAQEQLPDQISGKGNIATALILILVLAGIVAAIVFFLVKSSIRR